jgi:hypothetical protein
MIKIHSITDLITNSSTTIFTYSDGSPAAFDKMMAEILKAFGIEKRVDELFYTIVLNDLYSYSEYEDYFDGENIQIEDAIQDLLLQIAVGVKKAPKWLRAKPNQQSYLHIIPKDPKYVELAESVIDFLYSTHSEEGSTY